jgi:hypothetical protein
VNQGRFAAIKASSTDGSNNTAGDLSFSLRALGTDTNLTERMRLIANGSVGMGTAAPAAQLHVYGFGQITSSLADTGSTGGTLYLQDRAAPFGAGGTLVFGAASGRFAAIKGALTNGTANTQGDLTVSTRAVNTDGSMTERMRITSGGFVGIGTSGPGRLLDVVADVTRSGLGLTSQLSVRGNSSPTRKLNVGYDSSAGHGFIEAVDEGFSWQNLALQPGGGNVGIGMAAPTTALQVMGVITPGVDGAFDLGSAALRFNTLYAATGTINTSDVRLKRDVVDSDLGLEFVRKLRPVSYYWRTGDRDKHYGLIAQETAAVLKTEAKNDSGLGLIVHDRSSDRFGLRYTELIAPLIKAVQQLFDQHADLRRENAELRARLERLEVQLSTR